MANNDFLYESHDLSQLNFIRLDSDREISRGTIMILHSIGSSLESHMAIGRRYQEVGFDVYLFDLPGHGKTPASIVDELDVYNFASLLNTFVVDNKLEKVILIGHGFGAIVATYLYNFNNDHYKMVVLEDPYNKSLYSMVKENTLKSLIDSSADVSLENCDPGLQRLIISIRANPNDLMTFLRSGCSHVVLDFAYNIQKQMKCPLLIVVGEKDHIIGQEKAIKHYSKMGESKSNLVVEVINNAKHSPHRENEDEFFAIVYDFIKKNLK